MNLIQTLSELRAQPGAVRTRGLSDELLLSLAPAFPDLVEAVKSHRVVEPCRGWAQPSDHAPLISEFLF